MRISHKVVAVGLVLFSLLAIGCSHEVDLVVTNASKQSYPVTVSGPDIGAAGTGLPGLFQIGVVSPSHVTVCSPLAYLAALSSWRTTTPLPSRMCMET